MSRFEFAAETRSSRCLRKLIVQSAVAAAMVSGLAACSAIPDSAKPGAVYGEATPSPTQPGTVGFPDLANVPDQKPKVTNSSDQKAIAESLAEDRAAAREGDKELKAGGVLPPARGDEARSPNEAMMQPDVTELADEPTEMATIAPAPAKVEAPTPSAKETLAPVKQAAPALVAAPAPVPPPAAPRAAEVAPPPPVAAESAVEPAAVTPQQGTAPVEPDAPARPALQMPPGVIPMPDRGGHKSFSDILTPEQKEARKAAAAEEAKNAAEAGESEKAPDSGEVRAAPTEPVEVQPVPDNQ